MLTWRLASRITFPEGQRHAAKQMDPLLLLLLPAVLVVSGQNWSSLNGNAETERSSSSRLLPPKNGVPSSGAGKQQQQQRLQLCRRSMLLMQTIPSPEEALVARVLKHLAATTVLTWQGGTTAAVVHQLPGRALLTWRDVTLTGVTSSRLT
jgi:hypothetical protein